MFERFTRSARSVVTFAVEEAERRGDRHIGTEHLLLGLTRGRSLVAAAALQEAGVDTSRVRSALTDLESSALAAVGVDVDVLLGEAAATELPRGRWRWQRGQHRPFTTGAKQVLEGALHEALDLQSRRLEAEHVLLALTTLTGRDPAIQLLDLLEVDAAALRQAVTDRLGRVPSP